MAKITAKEFNDTVCNNLRLQIEHNLLTKKEKKFAEDLMKFRKSKEWTKKQADSARILTVHVMLFRPWL